MVVEVVGVGGSGSAVRCTECAGRLAHDQRYCLECGARRGALPRRFGEVVATVLEQGSVPSAEEPEPVAEARMFPSWMPAPRAAAIGVLIMLAFGVFAGSLASPTVTSLARQIIVEIAPRQVAPAAVASGNSVAASSGDSTSGPATETITQTSSQSTSPGSSGVAGGTAAGTGTTSSSAPSGPALGLPAIHHVFLIVLSGQSVFQTFSPVSTDHYLSHVLARQGELLQNYYAVATSPLANAIALVSGQGPNLGTAIDCPFFSPVIPGTALPHGQLSGDGCIYPPGTATIADQLTAAHRTWRAYVQDAATTGACTHPQSGATDNHATPGAKHAYVTWRNPFVYFTSLTGTPACHDDEVTFRRLAGDVKTAGTAPSLAYIIPSPCDDGSDTPCRAGAPAGLKPANGFLKRLIPEIKRSAAYKDNGLIAVTFDEAPQSGPRADHSACCSTPAYPNLPAGPTTTTSSTTTTTSTSTSTSTRSATSTTPTTSTTSTTPAPTASPTATSGGGLVGLLLISHFIKGGTTDLLDDYNHYSLLALIENLFGLSHLGYAADQKLPVLGASIFNGP